MRIAPLAVLLALGPLGCASSSPPESPSRLLYLAEYDMALVFVDHSGTRVELDPENRFVYEDELLSALFVAREDRISFEVENRTQSTFRLVWDEAAFIDHEGNSSRVMHSGVAPATRYLPQAPSIIPAATRYSDFVIPTDHVRFHEGIRGAEGVAVPAGWESLPIVRPLVNEVVQEDVESGVPPANAIFRNQVEGNRGKRFGLLLPIEGTDLRREYTFWFEILDSRITGPTPL